MCDDVVLSAEGRPTGGFSTPPDTTIKPSAGQESPIPVTKGLLFGVKFILAGVNEAVPNTYFRDKPHRTMRHRLYNLIDENNKSTWSARLFDNGIALLIFLNVSAIVLESFDTLHARYADLFHAFELFSIAIFSLEYLARLFTADLKYPELSSPRAVGKYMLSPMALIDLLAVLPAYLHLLIPFDLRILRILRLLRLARLFKLKRYMRSLQLIQEVVTEKRSELTATVFVSFIVLVVSSTLMYYVERDEQPDAFPNIVAAFWWAICTLTTVGYGDIVPVTVGGKIISSIIAVLGIGLVALPTGILSASFVEKLTRKDSDPEQCCPHCGKEI
jgi:voltage-gated potassium channel